MKNYTNLVKILTLFVIFQNSALASDVGVITSEIYSHFGYTVLENDMDEMVDKESNLAEDPRLQRTTLGRLLLPIAILLRDTKRLSQTYFVKGPSARIALSDFSQTLDFLNEKDESYFRWLFDRISYNKDFQNEIESSQILNKFKIRKKDWQFFEKVLTALPEKLPEIIKKVENVTLEEKNNFERSLKKRIAGAKEYVRNKILEQDVPNIDNEIILVDGKEVSVSDALVSVDRDDIVWRGFVIYPGEEHDWKNIMRHSFANGFMSHYNLRRDESEIKMRDIRVHRGHPNIPGNIFISTSTSSSVAFKFAKGDWNRELHNQSKTGMLCHILVRKGDFAVDYRKIDTIDTDYYDRYFDPEVNEREIAFIGEVPGENVLGCRVVQNGVEIKETFTKNPWALK